MIISSKYISTGVSIAHHSRLRRQEDPIVPWPPLGSKVVPGNVSVPSLLSIKWN